MEPRAKLSRYRISRGFSQAELARELDCDKSFISKVERGERIMVGRLAFELEDMTRNWEYGPIRARDWVGMDGAR